MNKPAHNVGDLVAAEDDNIPPKIVIGWIVDCDHRDYEDYLVEWSDGKKDRYNEKFIRNYKKLLDSLNK